MNMSLLWLLDFSQRYSNCQKRVVCGCLIGGFDQAELTSRIWLGNLGRVTRLFCIVV